MNPQRAPARWLLRVLNPIWRIRRVGLWSEVIFWNFWARSPASQAQRKLILDPNLGFPDNLAAVLERIPAEKVRVLEIGAGPVSNIGRRHPTKQIDLVPTDILADEYRRVLKRQGLEAPVPTIFADAERLTEYFPPESFDLVYAGNCLDHMASPLSAIMEMVKVVRAGGWIVLFHRCDEGERQGYAGLHRWNLTARSGRFVLWNPDQTIDVSELLAPCCQVGVLVHDQHIRVEVTKRRS